MDAGDIEGIRKLRMMVRGLTLIRDPGYSYQIRRTQICFAGDRSHAHENDIHGMLDKLNSSIQVM